MPKDLILPDLFVFCSNPERISPPTLPQELVEFLEASRIPYELHWRVDESQTRLGSKYHYDTLIRFPRESDAVLFKLRWL